MCFRYPSKLYMDKFYVLGLNTQNEVYDFSTNIWGQWPPAPQAVGAMSCMVTWRDSFIVFGGTFPPTGVQIFNHTTQVSSNGSMSAPLKSVCQLEILLLLVMQPTFLLLAIESTRLLYCKSSHLF